MTTPSWRFVWVLDSYQWINHSHQAAHCLRGKDIRSLHVYIGQVDVSRQKKEFQYKVRKAIPHRDFAFRPLPEHDIGIIKLARNISFNNQVRQSCLPTSDAKPDVSKCIAMGWGKMDNGKRPAILQKVSMKIKPSCRLQFDAKKIICAAGSPGKGGIWWVGNSTFNLHNLFDSFLVSFKPASVTRGDH